jgi:hypothetical protein
MEQCFSKVACVSSVALRIQRERITASAAFLFMRPHYRRLKTEYINEPILSKFYARARRIFGGRCPALELYPVRSELPALCFASAALGSPRYVRSDSREARNRSELPSLTSALRAALWIATSIRLRTRKFPSDRSSAPNA